MEKLPCDGSVAFDRRRGQPLPILKVSPKVGRKIIGRCGVDAGGFAHTETLQEFQQLRHVAPFTTPGLGADRSMSTATLILRDVSFAEISQGYAAFREPTVERQCVPCLDVDDVRRVLLLD